MSSKKYSVRTVTSNIQKQQNKLAEARNNTEFLHERKMLAAYINQFCFNVSDDEVITRLASLKFRFRKNGTFFIKSHMSSSWYVFHKDKNRTGGGFWYADLNR